MSNIILSKFKQILRSPYNLVTSPGTILKSLNGQTERGRGFWMGLPAILVAVLGLGALFFATFGAADALEYRYTMEVASSKKEIQEVAQELNAEMRAKKFNRQNSPGGDDAAEGISDDNPRLARLNEIWRDEEILLKKLVTLSPEEMDYRFQLALLAFEQAKIKGGNEKKAYVQKGLAMMMNLAPETEPGYDKAHMWLATHYLGQRVQNKSQLNFIRSKAFIHAEMCLVRDHNNKKAKLIKANLLMSENQLEKAYVIYKELYDSEPALYESLAKINDRLDRSHLNRTIYESAERHFLNLTKRPDIGVSDWMRAWSQVVKCQAQKKRLRGNRKTFVERVRQSGINRWRRSDQENFHR